MGTETTFIEKAGIVYWKMAILRVTLYALIVGNTEWISLTETIMDGDWGRLKPFEKIRIFQKCSLPVMGVVLAFMDNTMEKLRKDHPDNPEGTK